MQPGFPHSTSFPPCISSAKLRPEMKRKPEAVKVHHALDPVSCAQVRVQQFLLFLRHGGGEPVQLFLSDPRRRDEGRLLPVDFFPRQVIEDFQNVFHL